MVIVEEVWIDDPASPDPTASTDSFNVEKSQLIPPLNDSIVRIENLPPDSVTPDITPESLAENLSRFDLGDAMESDNPGFHTTPTKDYVIVLSGELCLELDEGQVRLRAGDIVVQRATRHAWHNRGTEPCAFAAVLISSPNYQ